MCRTILNLSFNVLQGEDNENIALDYIQMVVQHLKLSNESVSDRWII